MNNISDTYIVAADAVTVEPVSASSFPANREINREFCTFRPIISSGAAIYAMI